MNKITVTLKCTCCGTPQEIEVFEEDFKEYSSANRRHVQQIFPYVPADKREMFISGVCPKCWELMYKSTFS